MDTIKVTGVIEFDLKDKTKKHKNQASWKKIAMILIGDDLCSYYAWFIKKRYGIILNKPLRGPHLSLVNDSMKDLTHNGLKSENEAEMLWESVKEKWHGKEIEIVLSVDVRTDGNHWWFNIPHNERGQLQSIRDELGLSIPFFGFHISIGTPHPFYLEQSQYIHDCIKNCFIK